MSSHSLSPKLLSPKLSSPDLLTSRALRLVFAGSPGAAVPSLRALFASRHEIAAVITREPAPLGRRGVLTATPVAEVATELGIPTIASNRLTEDLTGTVAALKPDLGVIVAYGALVREPLMSTPRLGWINLHFSLLPRWRGAAPVQRAIIAGDTETGASVFQLVPDLDAGDIYATVEQPIGRRQTAGHLLDSLSRSGAELLVQVVDTLADGTAIAAAQAGEATIAPKLSLEDGRIDWTKDAETVANQIRGVTPEPGAFTNVDGTRLKVIEAAVSLGAAKLDPGILALYGAAVIVGTGSAPVELVHVLPAGKKVMAASDWWRGRSADAGAVAE
jgi:methionyl-tRNA formyltransferase